MLGKASHLIFSLTHLINSKIHEHSCKILYIIWEISGYLLYKPIRHIIHVHVGLVHTDVSITYNKFSFLNYSWNDSHIVVCKFASLSADMETKTKTNLHWLFLYCLFHFYTQEDELEQVQTERDELKRENFKLKQSLMRTEQKMNLMEIKRGIQTFCFLRYLMDIHLTKVVTYHPIFW